MSRPRAGRLRVGVNLLWLLPGAAGGAERYAVRLLRALTDETRGLGHITSAPCFEKRISAAERAEAET